MQNATQTFATHRRFPPLAFALALPVLLIDVVVRLVGVVQLPSLANGWAMVVAAALVVVAYYARRNAQIVQDRVIRLEMRRRLERVLPPERHADIIRLELAQLIALRFVSDEQLPALLSETLTQGLTPTALKQRITAWQADELRV